MDFNLQVMKKSLVFISSFFFLCSILKIVAQTSYQKMDPVNFIQVEIEDNFWKPKINLVSTVTIPFIINHSEKKIQNFEKVAAKKREEPKSILSNDGGVYKILESIAYSLKNHPDPELEKKADLWIDKIAAAQMH